MLSKLVKIINKIVPMAAWYTAAGALFCFGRVVNRAGRGSIIRLDHEEEAQHNRMLIYHGDIYSKCIHKLLH